MVKKDQYALVDPQGKESSDFPISMTIYGLIALALVFAMVGLVMVPAPLIATVTAGKDKSCQHPFTNTICQVKDRYII